MLNPVVSIVTPVYNGEEFIEECIKSIKNQTYTNIEHIIIDGGSTDNTINIVKKYESQYNMKWISEPDNGMYDAINKGFNLSRGEIIAWLNSDDMYMPWAIELVVTAMTRYSHIKWCTGIPAFWNEKNLLTGVAAICPLYYRKFIQKGLYDGRVLGFIQQESTFWMRELWIKAGARIPQDIKLAGDYYLWKKFACYEELYTLNTVLSGFRKHSNQKTNDLSLYYNEIPQRNIVIKIFYKIINKILMLKNSFKVYNNRLYVDLSRRA